MASLYKYLKREYAESMLSEGTVKIGTLHEYWPMELHGVEIGDNNEAMAFCEIPVEQFDKFLADDSPSQMAAWIRNMLKRSPEARHAETFLACYLAVDQYIYCTSTEYDESVMRSFGCDTCVEIWNSGLFFDLITTGLQERATYRGLYHCAYRPRRFKYEEAAKMAVEVLKDPRYAHQKEVRAVWYPKAFVEVGDAHPVDAPLPTLNPVLARSPGLAQWCCRLHSAK